MKHMKFFAIVVVILLSGCGVLSGLLSENDANDIQDSFTGIDRDLWEEFVRLTNLPDCQLPCWWGFELETVELPEVLDFVQERAFDRLQKEDSITGFSPEEWMKFNGYTLDFTGRGIPEIGDVDFYFSFDDMNVLQAIHLVMRSPYRWLPDESNPLLVSNILNDVETLPTIFVESARTARQNDFSLFLIYPEQRFQIRYSMNIFDEYPLICLNSENIEQVSIEITNFPNQLLEPGDTFVPVADSWLAQDTSITDEEFLEFFRDNPDTCLDLSQYP